MAKVFEGVWEGKKFPSFVFQEYPKWVTGMDGKDVIVADKREEMAVIAAVPEGVHDPVLEAKNKLVGELGDKAAELLAKEKENEALRKQNDEAMKLLKEMGDRLVKLESQKPAVAVLPEQPKNVSETPPPATAVEKPAIHNPLDALLKK